MRHLLLIVLLFSGSATIHAQWRVALLTGTATSHGDSRDEIDPAHPEFHAEGPATLTVAFAREHGPWRVGLELHHTSADLAEVSMSSVVTTRDVLKAWGTAFEVAHRIAGHRRAPALNLSVAAGIDRWTFNLAESSPRWRASARGALEAELPINRSWSAVIRGEVTGGPSVFKAAELPEGFVRRTAIRPGLVLGIARRP